MSDTNHSFLSRFIFGIFLSGFVVVSTEANEPPVVGYGWASTILGKDTQESLMLGFELGFSSTLKSELKKTFPISKILRVMSDTSGSPLGAEKVARQLLLDPNLVFLTGFPSSHESLLVSNLVQNQNDTLVLFVASNHQDLSMRGPNVFSSGESMDQIAESFLQISKKRFGGKKALVISNPRAVYSVNLERALKSRILEIPLELRQNFVFANIDGSGRLKTDSLEQLLNGTIDFLIITMYSDDADTLLAQLKGLPKEYPFITGGAWENIDPIRRHAARRKEPIYSAMSFVKGSPDSLNYENKLKVKFGIDPLGIASYGFDAGVIAATTLNRVKGPFTRAAVVKAFREDLCFEKTSIGKVCFPKDGGHANKKLYEVIFKKGEGFVRAKP